MPYRIPPRTEVPPEFRGPDFLTADLSPSARPGHRTRPVDPDSGGLGRRVTASGLAHSVVVASGLVPGGLTWWCSGSMTDGLAVGGFTALCSAVAAVAIGGSAG